MGLEQMTKLTNMASFKLRLTMRKFTGETRIETYSTFKVGNQVHLPNNDAIKLIIFLPLKIENSIEQNIA